MPSHQQKRLTLNSLIESGKTLTETGPMWYWKKPELLACIKKCSGEPAFRQAVESGKGVILAMPHLGSWELINLYCSIHYPITTLYRPPRLQQLDRFICDSRQRFGAILAPTNTTGIRSLYKALGNGGLVSILPDQEPGTDNGIFAPFFNVPAFTMTLLSRMAHKYHVPVFYGFAERLEDSSYHLHFIEADKKIAEAELATSVEQLNKGIEECIRLAPQQYQWGYKRFKTRPEGQQRFY